MEQRIRAEEAEKAKKLYGGYFMDAATKFKAKAYKGYGHGLVTGKVRGNSAFQRSRAFNGQSDNPYDSCFN